MSTITLLTCVVSVLSTFLVVGMVVLGFWVGWWVGGKWKGRREGWWRVWKWRFWKAEWARGWRVRLVDVEGGRDEERPLLVGNGERSGG